MKQQRRQILHLTSMQQPQCLKYASALDDSVRGTSLLIYTMSFLKMSLFIFPSASVAFIASGYPNPVRKDHNPARFSILPAKNKKKKPSKVGTQMEAV